MYPDPGRDHSGRHLEEVQEELLLVPLTHNHAASVWEGGLFKVML